MAAEWLLSGPVLAVGAGIIGLLLLMRVGALFGRLLFFGLLIAAAALAYSRMT